MASMAANRRFDQLNLVCELPVLAVSWQGSKKIFWTGWTILAGLAGYLAVVLVWLEFFWHW